jgi:hypothetical protein
MTDPAEGQPGVSLVDPNRTGRRPRNREHHHYRSSEDTVIFTGTNKAPSFKFSSGGEGRAQTPMRLRGSLRTSRRQNDVIKNARTDIAKIKSERQNLKGQNTELPEEIQSLRTELSAYSASLLPTRSWASVAESGASRPLPNNEQPISKQRTQTPSNWHASETRRCKYHRHQLY